MTEKHALTISYVKHHLFDGTLWRKVALFHALLIFRLHYPAIFRFSPLICSFIQQKKAMPRDCSL